MTELFIKIPTNEINQIINPNFTDGLTGWTTTYGTPSTDFGVCYSSGTTSIQQPNILITTGSYLLEVTIVTPRDGSAIDQYVTVELGNDAKSFTEIGTFKRYLNITSVVDTYLGINFVNGFNGGITNISITPLDGIWNKIDLKNTEDILLNFNIADIVDITSKSSSYSKSFEIPGTQNNNKLFKHIYNISTDGSFIMNKLIKCYIAQEDNVIFNGVFELIQCNILGEIIEYEGVVYSDLTTLYETISNKLLKNNELPGDNIDFSEYNHIMTVDYIEDSWDNFGSGVTYVAINKDGRSGTMNYKNYFKPDALTPSLFIKEIFDKIIEKAGFTYTSTFLESDYFKSLIYPYTSRWIRMAQFEADRSAAHLYADDNTTSITVTVAPLVDTKLNLSSPSGNETISDYYWDITSQGSYTPYVVNTFTAPVTGYYNLDINLSYYINLITNVVHSGEWELYTAGTKPVIYNRIKKNSTNLIEEITGDWLSQTITIEDDMTIDPIISDTFSYKATDIYLQSGDTITHEVRLYCPFTYTDTLWNGSAGTWFWRYLTNTGAATGVQLQLKADDSETNKFDIVLDTKITEGSLVNANYILHDNIKQADFISSISKMFNLYIEPIGNNNLIIEPRDDYFSTTITDWTSKMDISKSIEIVRASDIIEKVLRFHHDKDDTRLIKEYERNWSKIRDYGEFYQINDLNNDNENVLEIKTIFMSVPSTRNMESNNTIAQYSTLEMPLIYSDNYTSSINYEAKFKPCILHFYGLKNILNPTSSYFYLSGVTETIQYTSYPYCGHTSNPYDQTTGTTDLNFGTNPDRYYQSWNWSDWATSNNLYNMFYNNMISEYLDTDTKIVKMYLNLNSQDIYNFRFSKSILIDGVYYRVNKIIDYIEGQSTKVELLTIKIQDFNFKVTNKPYFDSIEMISTIENTLVLDNVTYDNTNVVIETTTDDVFVILDDNSLVEIVKKDYVDTTQSTDTVISFRDKNFFNTPMTPISGNIVDDLDDARLGLIQKIYHLGVAPSYPSNWVLTENAYIEGQLNIIYAEYCGDDRVEYWYKHQNIFDEGFIMTVTGSDFTIPTNGTGYNYSVYVDETSELFVNQTGDCTITFSSPGTYTIKITGQFPTIYFNSGTECLKLDTIEQWGNINWSSFSSSFYGCDNLNVSATDAPRLDNVTDLSGMFQDCTSFNGNLNNWDISNVIYLSYMFVNCTSFNQPLSNWWLSNVTEMRDMFQKCSIFNQDLNDWDTSNVENMAGVFYGCQAFNQDLDNWNTDNVTDMNNMFINCIVFDGDISTWNTENVTNMANMFRNAYVFNQDLSAWNTSSVIYMDGMFCKAYNFNQDISSWIVSNVTNMERMFYGVFDFNQDINIWDTSNVTNMGQMFMGASDFNQDISGWDTSNVTTMTRMFADAISFNQDLSTWCVSNIPSLPTGFDTGATSWVLSRPVWGTCP